MEEENQNKSDAYLKGHDGSGDITTLPDLALNSPPAAVVDRSSVFGAAA